MAFFVALGLGFIILGSATLLDLDTLMNLRTHFQKSWGDVPVDPSITKRFLRVWACALILVGLLLLSFPLLQRTALPSVLTSINAGHLVLSLFGFISGLGVLGLCVPSWGPAIWGPAWPGYLRNTRARRLKFAQTGLLALTFGCMGLLFGVRFYAVAPAILTSIRILALLLCILLLVLGRLVRRWETRSLEQTDDTN